MYLLYKDTTMWPKVRLGGCWVLLLAVASAQTTATRPPHIVFILADDLGWNDVSWHNKEVVTPRLEALARSGVLLEQSYVQPTCTPTRSALLAGRYPFTIGMQRGILKPSEPTGLDLNVTLLPQSLKKAGYSTHAVGKWHLGFCSWDYTPTMRGFDTFYGFYNGAGEYYTHKRSNQFDPSKDNCKDNCSYTRHETGPWLDLRNNTEPDYSKEGVYSTYLFASYVEQLLSSRSNEDPMFLYLALQSVHTPLEVPLKYTKKYNHIRNSRRRTYLGMVSAMDKAVDRVVAALKSSGHYNNSIIVFTTDNGGTTVHGANNWPLRGHKATLWEGGTRGAAFIHSPLLPNPGTVSNKLIHVTDWYRTLVGVARGVAPQDIDGVDQWAAITGDAPSPRTQMVYNIDNTTEFKAGVRLENYKLLVGPSGRGIWVPPPENNWKLRRNPNNWRFLVLTNTTAEVLIGNDHNKGTDLETGSPSSVDLANNHDFNTVGSTAVRTFSKSFVNLPDTLDGESTSNLTNPALGRSKEEYAERKAAKATELHEEVRHLLQFLTNDEDSKIRLYNLRDDPEERVNLAGRRTDVVVEGLQFLLQEMSRYVPADNKPNLPGAADPSRWNGVWSPGWC